LPQRSSPPPLNFLLTCFGSGGEVHPYIALGIALKNRGHRVTLATCEHYRGLARETGLPFKPLRPNLPDYEADAAVLEQLLDPRHGPERLFRELLLPALKDQYADLHAAAEGADFLVGHSLVMASALVAETRRLPWISCALQPMAFFSKYDPPVLGPGRLARALRRIGPRPWGLVRKLIERSVSHWDLPYHDYRRELGLEPAPGSLLFGGKFAPLGTIALFPKFLAAPQLDWPAGTFVAGFPRYDHQNYPGSAALERFLGEGPAPIIFTRGTAVDFGARAFFETSVAAAERLGRRALLVVGRDARNYPEENPRVLAVSHAPFGRIFPRAAAIVHQAGIGTSAQALRAGIPSLLVPGAFDQFDNACRLQRLGSARILPLNKYSLKTAVEELRALLENSVYQTKAKAIAEFLGPEDGAGEAARTLENLADKARSQSRATA